MGAARSGLWAPDSVYYEIRTFLVINMTLSFNQLIYGKILASEIYFVIHSRTFEQGPCLSTSARIFQTACSSPFLLKSVQFLSQPPRSRSWVLHAVTLQRKITDCSQSRIFLKTEILLFSILAICPCVNGVFEQEKRRFSKYGPQSGDFCLKRRFLRRWFKWGRTKTEVFEYDDVIHHVLGLRMASGYSIAFCSFVYTFPYGRAKTIQIRYVWTPVIFLTTQKKISVFQIMDMCGQGRRKLASCRLCKLLNVNPRGFYASELPHNQVIFKK